MQATTDITRLRARALPVYLGADAAVEAARRLAERVRLYALLHGDGQMRQACADMALSVLPLGIRDHEDAVRAALAFWASETDPAVWLAVVSGS